MNELFQAVLSLSLSGAVLIVLILACNRLFGGRLSKRFQYYIWLAAVLRLILPFSPQDGLLPALWRNAPWAERQVSAGETLDLAPGLPAESEGQPPAGARQSAENPPLSAAPLSLLRNLWVPWLAVAAGLLVRKITQYQSFVRYLRAGWSAADDLEALDCLAELGERMGVRRAVGLYTNRLTATPLLLGFRRPAVVLPGIPADREELRMICRHELTHVKRGDFCYKWLLQAALCLHWFNPLVHLMVKEANRACELSCDEAVLLALDAGERRKYGDTLLRSVQTPGGYREGPAALTLSESAKSLKERLAAIMKFRKPGAASAAAAVLLAAALFAGGYALGTYDPVQAGGGSRAENSGTTPEGLPVMSAENRVLYETYVSPVAITGLLRVSFTPEDASELSRFTLESMLSATAPELIEEHPGAVPAAKAEEHLMAKLPLYQWQVRNALAERYDEKTDTYELYGGLGGGPSIPVVTGSGREGELLTIEYTWYDRDPSSEEFRYAAGDHGILVVRLDERDEEAFQYVSNGVIPREEPPGQ